MFVTINELLLKKKKQILCSSSWITVMIQKMFDGFITYLFLVYVCMRVCYIIIIIIYSYLGLGVVRVEKLLEIKMLGQAFFLVQWCW